MVPFGATPREPGNAAGGDGDGDDIVDDKPRTEDR
jgi:hypothetical protein